MDAVTIAKEKSLKERTYFVGDCRVKDSDCEKYLGIYVDSHLNFNTQRKKNA